MKIDLFPIGDNLSTKDTPLKDNGTSFNIDLKCRKDGEIYHIAEQYIDLDTWDEEDSKDDDTFPVFYSRIHFNVDAANLNSDEITNIIVNFLGHYKLYLNHFDIVKRRTYVSYKTPENESDKIFDLAYNPAYKHDSIFIDAEVELEDGVDYSKVLNIKTKELFKTISDKKIKELGYEFKDYGIYNFAIINDKDTKEYLD